MLPMKLRSIFSALALFSALLSHATLSSAQTHWVSSWAASQQLPEPRNSLPADDLRDATLRQIVHLSIAGTQIRLHLSNRFGIAPLHFTAVTVARPVSPATPKLVAGTDKALRFSGSPEVTVPAGSEYVSDALPFSAAPLSDLAISLHVDSPPAQQTGHPGSRATSYLVHGNAVSADDLANPKTFEHWYFIAGVDVAAPAGASALVTLGDSITDGHGATTDGNDRWPDLLAQRLHANLATKDVAVLNHGIGGNRLLLDGLGPNALARFDHDVLAETGVRYLLVLEGVNDLGMMTRDGDVPDPEHEAAIRGIIGAYEQMITRAHAHGILAFGATVMPFVGSAFYHPGPHTEADRQAINTWIRAPGHFDAVIDFDQITRDPAHPDRLLPGFDSGDHLHPSPAGYAAMANAIPLTLFAKPLGPPPQIAFTFDDLPAHGPLPTGETRMTVASEIISALRENHAPAVYGFVNGLFMEQNASSGEVLKRWRAAGFPLGNHTWSHMNLNQHTAEEFEADLLRNEPLVGSLMAGEDWHWLRFPYLAEGDTPEKRSAIRSFLLQHGYRVAAVTMSFGDYRWNEPYARCKDKGDSKSIELLETSYLQAADQSIDYYRQLSKALFGRDIPYVLLMHIGAFDAEMLPRLLELYRARGFQFVTLEQAQRDDFYRVDTNLDVPPAPDTLEGLAGERHISAPPRPETSVQPETLCK
jgi:lysophospholipase L1-like esterase